MTQASQDVLVVGGGIAGLAAATRLAEAGARPLVLEAAPIAGGRARSWKDPRTNDVVDNGQHLLMGCYHETLAFLDRIGTLDRVQFQDRLRVAFADADGEGGTIDCPPLPGSLSLLAGLALYRGLEGADCLRLLHVIEDIRSERDSGVDETAASYLEELDQSPRARRAFWDPLIIAALNDRPEIVSARTLRRVVEAGLLAGAQASRLGWARVGLGDLYEPASAAYLSARGGALRTSAPVSSVGTGAGGIEALLRSGETVHASAAIIAVTPGALARILPDGLRNAPELRGLPLLQPSAIVGVNLWLDRTVVEERFVGLLGTTMQWLFNKGEMLGGSKGAASYLALIVSGARREVERDADDLVRTALADLRALFPAARRANLVHALVVKEREATTSPAPGWDAYRPGTRTSNPRIFLAGDWTATGLPATIESAVLSGHRAADAVLEGG